MAASTLVIIIVRLFAISWFVQGIIVSTEAVATQYASSRNFSDLYMAVGLGAVPFVFGLLSWFCAPAFGRLITRGYDAPISISEPALEKLYAFAFVFLGLYFILNSVGQTLVAAHSFLYALSLKNAHNPFYDQQKSLQSLYGFSRPLITLIAGFIVMLPAKRWAARLMQSQQKSEEVDAR